MAVFLYLTSVVIVATVTQVFSLSRDPCASFSCQNGGSCTAPADAPSCKCQPGFFGPHCEYNRDPCYNFGCQNGGSCTAPADAPYCLCPSGYTGTKCEIKGNGQCPVISSDTFGVCGGVFCSSDSDCSNGQICCASACGGKLCTTAEPVTKGPVCQGGCADGYVCKFQSKKCPAGQMCPAIMVPTCVPSNDQCGNCPTGQVCKATGIVCIKAPCPSFECVPVTAPAACNLACIRNYVCQLKPVDCPKFFSKYCSTKPVPTCVPQPKQLASCPKPAKIFNNYFCALQKRLPQCNSDTNCSAKRNERCCPNSCNRRQCTVVPALPMAS